MNLYSQSEILHIVRRNAEIVTAKQFIITKTYPNAIEASRHFRNIGATLPINAKTQSKVSAILKSYKSPIKIRYDLFLCVTRRAAY